MHYIPSSENSIGLDQFAVPFEQGMSDLVDTVGLSTLVNTLDGMLYHNGTTLLAQAASGTDHDRLYVSCRAQVLNELKGHLVNIMAERNEPNGHSI